MGVCTPGSMQRVKASGIDPPFPVKVRVSIISQCLEMSSQKAKIPNCDLFSCVFLHCNSTSYCLTNSRLVAYVLSLDVMQILTMTDELHAK